MTGSTRTTRSAAAQPPYPPNTRLQWHRRKRGWSQAELASQLKRSIEAEEGTYSGRVRLSESVGDWERGRKRPGANYEKHLCKVFELNAAQLGLLTPDELALRPDDDVDEVTGSTLDAALIKQMMELWVRSIGKGSAEVSLEAQVSTISVELRSVLGAVCQPDGRRMPDPTDAASYLHTALTHHRWYWTLDAGTLLDAVLAQLRLGVQLLKPAQADSNRFRALAGAVALEGLLAARLSFFDLGRASLATRCFEVATAAVDVSEDSALSAAVYAHRALVPALTGDRQQAGAADDLLQAAFGFARDAEGPLLRSWLACVAAEIHARTGRPQQSLASITRAQDALDGSGDDPAWLNWYDRARWAGFAGNACLLAGKHAKAETYLQTALNDLGTEGAKQRPVLLLDLAASQAPVDPGLASSTAHRALDALAAAPYATANARLSQLRTALHDTRFAAELEDRVRALPAAES